MVLSGVKFFMKTYVRLKEHLVGYGLDSVDVVAKMSMY